jgi:hypothetical protein
MNEWMAQEYAEAGGTVPVEVVKTDAMVLWQEPGDNYVRVGELKSIGLYGGMEVRGILGDAVTVYNCEVKRWGSVEIVRQDLLKVVA